jgi:hypothetical protein
VYKSSGGLCKHAAKSCAHDLDANNRRKSSKSTFTGMPTQCFIDVILVPLPTWVLIALAFVILPATLRTAITEKLKRGVYKKRWHRILHLSFYYFFILAIAIIESVEVARLAQINLGVGLIPFVYVGCAAIAGLQATHGLWGRLHGWQIASVMFWVMSCAISLVKRIALSRLSKEEAFRREEGPYSVSHQTTNVAIMMAFYAGLIGHEIGLVFSMPWSESVRHQSIGQAEQKV